MQALAAKLRAWWKAPPEQVSDAVPFEVACVCDYVIRGERKKRHQVARCPQCRRRVFILPLSRLPTPAIEDATTNASMPSIVVKPAAGRNTRRVIAAVLGVVVVCAIGLWAATRRGSDRSAAAGGGRPVDERIAAGTESLKDGHFRLAAQEFEAANAIANSRQTTQLARQASLLADVVEWSLADNPRRDFPLSQQALRQLETILRKAPTAGVQAEREWQAQFERRYQGQAIVFDNDIHRDAGRYYLKQTLKVNSRQALIELGDLRLLHDLPNDWPRELLLGARLASCRLEPPGTYWVFRFQPDSGVLFTDQDALAAYAGAPPDERQRRLLRQQAEWLGNAR